MAQLTEGARTANGIVAVILGVSYLLRALGDSAADGGTRWLSWLSPIGWAQQVRPFAGDRWLVALLPVALLLVAMTAAFALVRRRDVGAGLVRPRPGSCHRRPQSALTAGAGLAAAPRLAVRLGGRASSCSARSSATSRPTSTASWTARARRR